jgi:hypothetical protein
MRLSPLARGVYRELLDHCWKNGSLPKDPEILAGMAAISFKDFRKIWPELFPLFTEKEGRFHHETVDQKRPQLAEYKEKLSANGRKGAMARHMAPPQAPPVAPPLAPLKPGLGPATGPASALILTTYNRESTVEVQKQTRAAQTGLDLADAFEPIWLAYPAKGRIKRPEAERQFWEWLAPQPEEKQRELIAMLAASIADDGPWVRSQNWVDGYIPGLSEFIRLRRYQESPEPWAPKPTGRKQHNLVDLGGPDPYADLAK